MAIDFYLEQKATCERFSVEFMSSPLDSIAGVSKDYRQNVVPVNGMRCLPGEGENGWYIWMGEDLRQDDDFFQPVHVSHILAARPEIAKFLGLPPGWRFLLAGEYEDVWFDASLLNA